MPIQLALSAIQLHDALSPNEFLITIIQIISDMNIRTADNADWIGLIGDPYCVKYDNL